jgi:hypothetical protein
MHDSTNDTRASKWHAQWRGLRPVSSAIRATRLEIKIWIILPTASSPTKQFWCWDHSTLHKCAFIINQNAQHPNVLVAKGVRPLRSPMALTGDTHLIKSGKRVACWHLA